MRILLILLFISGLTAAVLVLGFEVPPELIGFWVNRVIGGILSVACPLFFLIMLMAPGIGYGISQDLQEWWERFKGHRSEIEDLTQRINHLGKPHHMAQLAGIYLRQGRYKLAGDWFSKALEKDGTLLDARYRLAICRMREKRFQEAAELLEQVHATKPDHDYGGLYLRLAQASEMTGNTERSAQVYSTLLKYYQGHPEGHYGYGLLLERTGQVADARKQMEQVVFSVRNSPSFQRRRNRHWRWKARWWLWKNGRGDRASVGRPE